MTDIVWNKSSEAPIVWTVFEEIHYWHSAVRKPMYKHCFKNTFSIMERPAVSSNSEEIKTNNFINKNVIFYTFLLLNINLKQDE